MLEALLANTHLFAFVFFLKFLRVAARFLHFFSHSFEASLLSFIYYRICSEKVTEEMNLNYMLVIIKSKPFLLKRFLHIYKGITRVSDSYARAFNVNPFVK